MDPRPGLSILTFILMTLPAHAGGIVTLDLRSPVGGNNYRGVGPATVEWTITAHVSAKDNMGLAGISVDFMQDLFNPAAVIIEPAEAVPPEMIGFDRPAGISNPGAGYVGTRVGSYFGAKNLVQIGGAQNTFGGPPEPPVPGIGEDWQVEPNIGQLRAGQVIASGSFAGPSAFGVYTFSIDSPVATTLDYVNEPPKWSPVSTATVEMGDSGGTFGFVLCVAADVDGDFGLTASDIALFVSLLLEWDTADAYQTCAADLDDSGQIDGADIQQFVDAYLAG